MQKIKLVIVDDQREYCNLFRQYISMVEDFEFVGWANNGYDGLDLIEKKKPDVVVLDSFMPDLDGIGLLKRLPKLNLDRIPNVIVVTAYPTDAILSNARSLGVDYVMSRKNDIDEIVERCRMAVIASNTNAELKDPYEEAERLVTAYIQSIGIPANVKGYQFLRTAIMIVADNPQRIMGITKDLYPEVAKKFGTTASKVERNIRNAIEIAFNRGNEEVIAEIFSGTISPTKGRPTNSEFIALISDKICMSVGKYKRNFID